MPYSEDQLPELPRESRNFMRDLITRLGPRWEWDKGVNYDAGPVDLRLSNKGLRAQGSLGPAELEAVAKLNGWQANAQLPIGNAIAKFMAGNKNGINSYGANIMLPILGGDLTLDAQRNDGNNRYGLTFGKTFR